MSDSTYQTRSLDWPNCLNIRDLGGLPTPDNGVTKWQAVIRSDLVNDLNADGQQMLLDYGVRTTIDLRAPREVEKKPSIYQNQSEGLIHYVNQPLEHFYPHVGELISNASSRGEVYCIILDHYADLICSALRLIANADEGGVLIHCQAGKDRTGTISALLLKLVGVEDDVIAADYAESQANLWPIYEKAVEQAGGAEQVGFWSQPSVTADMMHLMLDHVAGRYGDVESYSIQAGMTTVELDKIKKRLR
ncbi:MAG: tyrosine-protein phosphatase [Chloroflexota bacterium]